jgi:hypothetical protein
MKSLYGELASTTFMFSLNSETVVWVGNFSAELYSG